MLTLKMKREFLVIQVVFQFLGVQVIGRSNEIEIGQISGHTSSGDSDETIEINVIREIPGHTAHGCIMEAAEILTTLATGGDLDWLPDLTVPDKEPEAEESPLEVLVALAEEAKYRNKSDAEFLGIQMCQFLGIQVRSHL